jgi:hypothetical protein
MLAMQNDSVDAQYLLVSRMAQQYAKDMKQPRPLVLRLHSKESELSAVKAMTKPTYNPNSFEPRFNVDLSVKVKSSYQMLRRNARRSNSQNRKVVRTV